MASLKSNISNTHFILVPLMAAGHMIPMIDMSKIIAKHGNIVTIITTPKNASRVKETIDRAVEIDNLDIRLCEVNFPPTEGIIPEGCENIDMLPSLSFCLDFYRVMIKIQEPFEKLLESIQPKPTCIISDTGHFWTSEIAKKMNIPRIVFDGIGCFPLLCLQILENSDFLESITSEDEAFAIPNLPDKILISKALMTKSMTEKGESYVIRQKMIQAANDSFGVVVNSFKELEPEYFERFRKARGKNVWCVGPVSLCNRDNLDKENRGNKTVITSDECLKWLDLQKPNSVIYVSLGSLYNLPPSQLLELALGLEASNRPFILTLRDGNDLKVLETLIDEDGFMERVEGRGLIIKGWAPQVLILSHSAVGGFLTHCGWNSTLEGLSAGLPMVTFPMHRDQFLNEEYLVHVLKIATKIRNPIKDRCGKETNNAELKRENVKSAVELIMDEQGQGKEMRERATMIGSMAQKAVLEQGSSHKDMILMIQQVTHHVEKLKDQES